MNTNLEHHKDATPLSNTSRQAVVDLLFVLVTLFTLKWLFLQFEATWTFAGPISLLVSLAVATWRLNRSSESWRQLGFASKGTKLSLCLWTIGALAATIILGNIAQQVASSLIAETNSVDQQAVDAMSNRFKNVPGNFPVYFYWLIVSWVIGGLTEELLFRGFLINRFEKAMAGIPFAIGFAIIFQAVIFGQQHMYYQGWVGFAATGAIGLISGLIYVFSKRRLLPLVLSHGLANTLGMTLMYLGVQP